MAFNKDIEIGDNQSMIKTGYPLFITIEMRRYPFLLFLLINSIFWVDISSVGQGCIYGDDD